MGHLRATEMIEIAGFDIALRDHLTAGMFPPVKAGMIEPALRLANEAIEAMVDEDYGRVLDVETNPVRAEVVCAGWHLDAFVNAKLYEAEQDILDSELADAKGRPEVER